MEELSYIRTEVVSPDLIIFTEITLSYDDWQKDV